MRKVYLIRHAEKDPEGILTDRGRDAARSASVHMPKFDEVYSSESERCKETARLISGVEPKSDKRAGFYMAPKAKSDAINAIATDRHVTFLEAVKEYNDEEVLEGVSDQADKLNQMIDELLRSNGEGSSALIVSHDLSISPAMAKRDIPLESIDFLNGYTIDENGKVTEYDPSR